MSAPVLAWVVPWDAHGIVDKNGDPQGQRVARDVAEVQARDCDTAWPHRAPHTVQQLARVVRVVAVDDAATVTRMARAICRDHADVCGVNRGDAWKLYADDFKAQARLYLAAALTPPEPTGNSSFSPAERNLSVSPEPTGTEGA